MGGRGLVGRGACGCFYTVCLGITGMLGAMGRLRKFLMRLASNIASVNSASSSLGSTLGCTELVATVGASNAPILIRLAICVLSLLNSAAIITWSSLRYSLMRAMISTVEVAVAAASAAFRSDYQSAVASSN